jgi:hypothetical protein
LSRLRVAVIVEGDGEVAAVPVLLRRLWMELGGEYIEILGPPIRRKRSDFERRNELERAVGLAASKLKHAPATNDPSLVLILFDRDPSQQPPCQLGPQAKNWARSAYAHLDIECVVVNVEYETWFVAAAESLGKYLELDTGEAVPDLPEQQRCGKGWIEARFRGAKYSETQDQPRMSATMDFASARQRSPSFDKLCRELELRARRAASHEQPSP